MRKGDPNIPSVLEAFEAMGREPVMVQKYLPEVSEGDKRIILIDGEPVGGVNRKPAQGSVRANMVHGGTPEKLDLSERDLEICARVGPMMREDGLLFVGIDVIGVYLTEINVTSPTGLAALDKLSGQNTAAILWDAIERRVSGS